MDPHLAEQALFRREVLQARAPATVGAIRLATPLSHRVWAALGVCFAASLCVWLGVGHYTRRERVVGNLTPQAGLLTVSARVLGNLATVHATEGATVRAGDTLATISTERSSATFDDTAADISAQLRQQQARLQADIDGAQKLAGVQASELRKQIITFDRQLVQVNAQIAVERRQVAELSALLSRFEGLGNKGYVSVIEVQQQRNQKANAEQQAQAFMRQRVELQQQRDSARNQLNELPLTTAAKLNDLHRQLAQVNQSLAQNESERTSVLRAPADGVVSAVLVKPGQTITPGQAVVSLVPKDSVLQAQLWVPSKAIGFVHTGTSVVLRYTAYPYQKFGAQRGTVTAVSRSALTPAELAAVLGQASAQESLYRVDVALPAQHIDVYDQPESLRPGMAVEADLLLEERRMVEWIFEPLYGLGRRSSGGHA
jgi:membrane fusion protein